MQCAKCLHTSVLFHCITILGLNSVAPGMHILQIVHGIIINIAYYMYVPNPWLI